MSTISSDVRMNVACLEQVFVANPNKPKPIVEILTGNQEKLLKYLTNFHTDKGTGLVVRITTNLLCPASTLQYLPDDHY